MANVKLKMARWGHARTADGLADNEYTGGPVRIGQGSVLVTYVKERDMLFDHHTYGECWLTYEDFQKAFRRCRNEALGDGGHGDLKLTPFQIEHATAVDFVLFADDRHG